jgi:hypothetical protein
VTQSTWWVQRQIEQLIEMWYEFKYKFSNNIF